MAEFLPAMKGGSHRDTVLLPYANESAANMNEYANGLVNSTECHVEQRKERLVNDKSSCHFCLVYIKYLNNYLWPPLLLFYICVSLPYLSYQGHEMEIPCLFMVITLKLLYFHDIYFFSECEIEAA